MCALSQQFPASPSSFSDLSSHKPAVDVAHTEGKEQKSGQRYDDCSRYSIISETAIFVIRIVSWVIFVVDSRQFCGYEDISSIQTRFRQQWCSLKPLVKNAANPKRCIRVWFSSYLPTHRRLSSFLDYPHLPSFACDSKPCSTFRI